jgi:NAD(P)-dependent dehydrogenase (short-subunit alcohol dehydrogenase family)
MDTNSNKQIALVTGGSRGIGAAIALELGAANHIVIINYNHSKEEADKIAAKIKENGGEAHIVQGNIANSEECASICQFIKENYGVIDILVNNAGMERSNKHKLKQCFSSLSISYSRNDRTNTRPNHKYQFSDWIIWRFRSNKLCCCKSRFDWF